MIKIINGLRYDTEKAIFIASWNNDRSIGDFSYYKETLYQTINGRFFLFCQGQDPGEYRQGQKGIVPLTRAETEAWLEYRDFPESCFAHFSDEIEDA